MLAKSYRLPTKEKFGKANSYLTSYFRMFLKPNSLDANRFGFVISKKINKNAVDRNRMRRILSEAVKEFIKTEKSIDALFVVNKDFVDVKTEEIFKTVKELLSKIQVRNL